MGDLFSITSVTRPPDTRVLLDLAKHRSRIVELGTATAWTAITLALDDTERHVITYDPFDRPEPECYLSLVRRDVRDRIEMVIAAGSTGPRDREPVDLLYIDSSHEREQTIEEVRAWQPHLRTGALIIFDDYTHPDFPGIKEAVEDLALEGEQRGKLFIHRHHREQVALEWTRFDGHLDCFRGLDAKGWCLCRDQRVGIQRSSSVRRWVWFVRAAR